MKPITYIIIAVLIAALIIMIVLSVPATEPDEPITPEIYCKAGSEIIDRRYTPPDTYEALYRTTFENGLTVEQWREISREEYEDIGNETIDELY